MPTTSELAEHLLSSTPEHAGWSLVESPNAAGHYDELREWARSLDYETWRTDIVIRKRHLGLVLLWIESEIARRYGGDGSLWPILSDRQVVPWGNGAYGQLFNYEGNATPLHRELLKNAAEHLSLRQTFDEEDGKNWYRLIYLQFGFTHEDAKQRLSAWLSGHLLPVSVQKLLESDDSGARKFQEIWRSLRMFRLGNLGRHTLEDRLKNNPWVLPEWCNDLIQAAQQSNAPDMELADLDTVTISFVTAPQLCWPEDAGPAFTVSLCNLENLGLDAAEYQLKIGGRVLAKLIRQKDGSYYSDAPDQITLPPQPIVAISLWKMDGQIAAHEETVLWDSGAEVTLYSLQKGALISREDRVIVGTGVLIIASADTTFEPKPAAFVDLPLGYRLHRIAKGWTAQLKAFLDDDVVWTHTAGARSTGASESLSVSAYFPQTLDLTAPEWRSPPPWKLPIHFRIPEGWAFERLRWTRADGHLVELSEPPKALSLMEADAISPVVLRMRIVAGSVRRTETLRVPVPFVAALRWNEHDKPTHHAPDHKLVLGDARRKTWSFNLPPAGLGQLRDPRLCSFVEGRLLHSRLKGRRSTLPDLGGYGAPLRILEDPYQDGRPVLVVAPCVVDGGELRSVTWRAEENAFHIKSRFTELGPEHKLLVWHSGAGGDMTVDELTQDKLQPTDGGWLWPEATGQRWHGVALEFRGIRLGAWFDPHSWSNAVVAIPPKKTESIAMRLRSWKAPLLQTEGGHFNNIVAWLRDHWVTVLPIWLPIKGQAELSSSQKNWQAVINELLTAALPVPDKESTRALLASLEPKSGGVNAIGSAFWRIAYACPILTVRVTRIALAQLPVADRRQFFDLMLNLPEFSVSDERASEIGRSCGNRDGGWLQKTVPNFSILEGAGSTEIKRPYRILSKNQDYRLYVLGRWLREIRSTTIS